MSSCPILQFDKVPSKYSEGYSSYRADEKSISNKTKDNSTRTKVRKPKLSLLYATSSGPVLHFYQLSPSIIKIFQRVFDLQSGHKING